MTYGTRAAAAIALLCAWASGPAPAQPIDESLRLKLERQLRLAPTRPERDSARFLEADRIESEQNRRIVATGNVTIRQRGASIRADRIDYSVPDQVAEATGAV
ncbi:MAG TPA: hypothetical protein VLC53_16065, partial [Myxococcota bacterium]|nr:hypothetical protein [Myxococcota bacterium]